MPRVQCFFTVVKRPCFGVACSAAARPLQFSNQIAPFQPDLFYLDLNQEVFQLVETIQISEQIPFEFISGLTTPNRTRLSRKVSRAIWRMAGQGRGVRVRIGIG